MKRLPLAASDFTIVNLRCCYSRWLHCFDLQILSLLDMLKSIEVTRGGFPRPDDEWMNFSDCCGVPTQMMTIIIMTNDGLYV